MVGRYYDPATGQFLTVHPDVAETGQPYAYTGDDPVNGVDPMGLSWYNPSWAHKAVHRLARGAAKVGHFVATHKKAVVTAAIIIATIPLDATGAGEAIDAEAVAADVAADGAEDAVAEEAGEEEAGSLRYVVNPLGGGSNCVNCAVATDATVSGSPASALDSAGPQPISMLEDTYGGAFKDVSGPGEIGDLLQAAGPGARGIVYGGRAAGQAGHVFNALNDSGAIRFLDGQSGSASFEGYSSFKFLFTNIP